MASRTLLHFHFKRMRIVTTCAGIIAFYMGVLCIIGVAFIFITAMHHASIKRGSSGIVMDIFEAKGNIITLVIFYRGRNLIGINVLTKFGNERIDTHFGLTALMAFHTTHIITSGNLHAGRELNGGLDQSDRVVTGNTLNPLGIDSRYRRVYFSKFRTIHTEIILIACTGMALGAGGRHPIGVFSGIIPMSERLIRDVGMGAGLPVCQIWGIRHGGSGSFFCCCRLVCCFRR